MSDLSTCRLLIKNIVIYCKIVRFTLNINEVSLNHFVYYRFILGHIKWISEMSLTGEREKKPKHISMSSYLHNTLIQIDQAGLI